MTGCLRVTKRKINRGVRVCIHIAIDLRSELLANAGVPRDGLQHSMYQDVRVQACAYMQPAEAGAPCPTLQ